MRDTVEVDPNKFTWNCPNCEVRNFAGPTILDTPFGEVTCRNCGFQFGAEEPKEQCGEWCDVCNAPQMVLADGGHKCGQCEKCGAANAKWVGECLMCSWCAAVPRKDHSNATEG